MKVKQVPVGLIIEADDNPNRMDPAEFEILKEQVQRFGMLLQPPLLRTVDEGLLIVDGHHRVRAASEAGLKKIPAVVLDAGEHLDDRILQVSMNKLRGRLDLHKVGQLAADLAGDGVPLEDVILMGFEEDEIQDLVSNLTNTEVPKLDDFAALKEEDLGDGPIKPFVLELEFSDRAEYKAARKALKAAGDGDLAEGLMNLIAADTAEIA